jgi:hypothetical protein
LIHNASNADLSQCAKTTSSASSSPNVKRAV